MACASLSFSGQLLFSVDDGSCVVFVYLERESNLTNGRAIVVIIRDWGGFCAPWSLGNRVGLFESLYCYYNKYNAHVISVTRYVISFD